MLRKVQKQLPVADADNMLKQLDLLHQVMQDYHAGLSTDQRKGVRTMAEGREGFAKLVSDIAIVHQESLPRNEYPGDLKEALAYYSLLSGVRLAAAKLYEMVDDTQTTIGIDIMAMTDRFSGYLQTARKANNALDMALNEVDNWNSRFGADAKEPVQAA